MATPPLHLAVVSSIVPPVAGPVHLPDVQQGLLAAELAPHPQPLAHGREAVQVPPRRMRKGLQRTEQHEAARAGLPQFRKQQQRVSAGFLIIFTNGSAETKGVDFFPYAVDGPQHGAIAPLLHFLLETQKRLF